MASMRVTRAVWGGNHFALEDRWRVWKAALWLAGLVALTSACAGREGVAQDCRLERIAAMPVETRQNFILVSATLDGQPTTFMVDTGAEATLLTPAALARLGLATDPSHSTTIRGLAGSVRYPAAKVGRFSLEGAVLRDRVLSIGPLPTPVLNGRPVDGLLGVDILSAFDIDMNVPDREMTLYAASHCAGSFVPWNVPYASVPVKRSQRGRLFLPVRVDGHELSAFVDTGARITVMTTEAAARVGVNLAALDRDPGGRGRGIDLNNVIVHRHMFTEIGVGPELFRNRPIDVAGLDLDRGDMLLGADYFRARRVWLSYAANRLFIALPTPRLRAAAGLPPLP
jgi:predicted aspartyl protease